MEKPRSLIIFWNSAYLPVSRFSRGVANPTVAVKVKMNGAFSANLDSPARFCFVVIKAGKHKSACPPPLILRRGTLPNWNRQRPSTMRGLAALPTRQRDGGRRSRPCASPFISALTGARWPATFLAAPLPLVDILSTSGPRRTRDGGLYTCRRSLKPNRIFVHSRSQKPVRFPAGENGRVNTRHPRFPRQPRQQV